jgi:hypothetical protein
MTMPNLGLKRKLAQLGDWERKKLAGLGDNIKGRVKDKMELRRIEQEAYREQAKIEAACRGKIRAKQGGGGFLGALSDLNSSLSGFDIWGTPKKGNTHSET